MHRTMLSQLQLSFVASLRESGSPDEVEIPGEPAGSEAGAEAEAGAEPEAGTTEPEAGTTEPEAGTTAAEAGTDGPGPEATEGPDAATADWGAPEE
jgi:hypothetical protein